MSSKQDCPYQRIEYIEASEAGGGGWINTEYVPDGDDIDIYCKFMPLGYAEQFSYWFGNYYSNKCFAVFRNVTIDSQICVNYNSIDGQRIIFNDIEFGKIYELNMYDNSEVSLNGVTYPRDLVNAAVNYNPIALFTTYGSGKMRQSYGRFYSFKVWKTKELVLDLIPVRVADEGFMYDRVSGKLFGNVGTGKFILGPDIS